MVAATARRRAEGLVPFDPFRHLGQVTGLITQAFAGELGPAARHVLRRMQQMARWGGLGLWLMGVETDAWGASGFVWMEGTRVVGNSSLRRAAAPGGWVIGNVAVHPEWRGRGIGRELVEATVDAVRERGGTWVGLEVQANNDIARGLYERLGFGNVGSMLELARPAGSPWPSVDDPVLSLRRARATDGGTLYKLAQEGLGRPHREVLEVRPSAYRAGWEARLTAFLDGCRENWWLAEEAGQVVGALRTSNRWSGHWHQLEVLVRQERLSDLGPRLAKAGLAKLARQRSWEATVSLPGAREVLEPIFSEAGFHRSRNLLQMRLVLGRQIAATV